MRNLTGHWPLLCTTTLCVMNAAELTVSDDCIRCQKTNGPTIRNANGDGYLHVFLHLGNDGARYIGLSELDAHGRCMRITHHIRPFVEVLSQLACPNTLLTHIDPQDELATPNIGCDSYNMSRTIMLPMQPVLFP